MKIYKIEFYVPESDLEHVKTKIFEAGAGKIGNYDSCCWVTPGTGQFRPLAGSNPYIGNKGEIETVEEYKVELICSEKDLSKSIEALIQSHPYETPAYQYWAVN